MVRQHGGSRQQRQDVDRGAVTQGQLYHGGRMELRKQCQDRGNDGIKNNKSPAALSQLNKVEWGHSHQQGLHNGICSVLRKNKKRKSQKTKRGRERTPQQEQQQEPDSSEALQDLWQMQTNGNANRAAGEGRGIPTEGAQSRSSL